MKWLVARRWVAITCALVTVGSATLAAQQMRYDSTVVSVRGNGPTTFVLISGMVGASTDTSRDHDYTDWDAVDRYADEVATLVK